MNVTESAPARVEANPTGILHHPLYVDGRPQALCGAPTKGVIHLGEMIQCAMCRELLRAARKP